MKKILSICLVFALAAVLLPGCGMLPQPSVPGNEPTSSPMIVTPDLEDGITRDEDGIITDEDTGAIRDAQPTPRADRGEEQGSDTAPGTGTDEERGSEKAGDMATARPGTMSRAK